MSILGDEATVKRACDMIRNHLVPAMNICGCQPLNEEQVEHVRNALTAILTESAAELRAANALLKDAEAERDRLAAAAHEARFPGGDQ